VRRSHDIIEMIGGHKHKPPYICPLPQHIHGAHTPSFSVFWRDGVQHFRCHGNCNLVGDVIDFAGYMYIPNYNPSDKHRFMAAVAYLEGKIDISIPIPEKEIRLSGSEWYEYLPIGPDALAYARSRGLNQATVEKFRLGQKENFLVIPSFEEGRLQGIKLRNVLPGTFRYMSMDGSRQSLFNCDTVAYSTLPVFIVKAEIPCMLLHQEGYLACAPTGGEGGWTERWRSYLALSSNIVVGDNDGPGRALAPKRAALFGAKLVYPPDPHKDVDEWMLADHAGFKTQMDQWLKEAAEDGSK